MGGVFDVWAICFAYAAIEKDCSGLPEACVCLGIAELIHVIQDYTEVVKEFKEKK